MNFARKHVSVAIFAGIIALGQAAPAAAYEDGDDSNIILDVALLRPVGFVTLVASSALYVVSLPFQLTSWSFKTPFDALVKRPFQYTFTRDLGEEDL
jgi:hypothetical protein